MSDCDLGLPGRCDGCGGKATRASARDADFENGRAAAGGSEGTRQCQRDEAGQASRGVRGGHEREGADVPTGELERHPVGLNHLIVIAGLTQGCPVPVSGDATQHRHARPWAWHPRVCQT